MKAMEDAAGRSTSSLEADASERTLNSRAVVVFTALAYLFTGFGFTYLDRGYGSFGFECSLWAIWTLLGFGACVLHLGKPAIAGRIQWLVLGSLGAVLALFPGFLIYNNLLRWGSLALMVVVGARAAVMRTRRDFYITLLTVFVVSFMVATHGAADWTAWFYLGPSWLFGGLALTWDHASGTPIARRTKLGMTLGFIAASFALSALLFLFAPRPPVLGFGFLPPGTNSPSAFPWPAPLAGDDGAGETGGRRGGAGAAGGDASLSAGAGRKDALGQNQGQLQRQFRSMVAGMRAALGDPFIPQWQRHMMGRLLDAAETLLNRMASVPPQSIDVGKGVEGDRSAEGGEITISPRDLLVVAILLLLAFLLWRRRYRIAIGISLASAWMLAFFFPALSMRLSALVVKWCLRLSGHPRAPGQSVREHWLSANSEPLVKQWLGRAVELYCAMRFGGVAPSRGHALNMCEVVAVAKDFMLISPPASDRK